MAEKKKKTVKRYFESEIPVDEHISKKVDKDGYRSALKFLDENNSLNGPMKVREVDISAMTHENDVKIAEFQRDIARYEAKRKAEARRMASDNFSNLIALGNTVSELIGDGLEIATFYKDNIHPFMRDKAVPWTKRQLSRVFPKLSPSEEIEAELVERSSVEQDKQETDIVSQIVINLEGFLNSVNQAYSYYRFHMDEEEARQVFLEIIFLSAELAKRIRYFSDRLIVPDSVKLDDDLQRKWKTVFEEIASVKTSEAINQILQGENHLLDAPNILSQYKMIGGEVNPEQELLPLDFNRFRDALTIDVE